MNPTILNRNFQHPTDGWYQIEPKGDHANRAAGVIQIIDDQAAESIVNRFNEDAGKPNFAGMLVDHEHFKHDLEKETRAYGWLMKLENRDDGIYGQVRWSQTGKAAVDGGDYRFFSTEYDPSDLKVLNAEKPQRVRPLRLDGLTLTNQPNNKSGRPITNRQPEEFRRNHAADNHNDRKTMKTVSTLLGLSADASEESVHEAVTKVMNRATTAEGKVAPLTNRVTELETANTTLLTEQIAADFAAAGIKDEKIVNRHTPVLSDPKHFKNRQERLDFIKDLVKPAAGGNGQRKLLNRDTTNPDSSEAGAGDEAARVQKAEGEIRNYMITNRCNYSSARQVMRAQKPELFTNPAQ